MVSPSSTSILLLDSVAPRKVIRTCERWEDIERSAHTSSTTRSGILS